MPSGSWTAPSKLRVSRTLRVPELDPDTLEFPDPCDALADPDGLLAMGGDLSPNRLVTAYANGIFPWYSDGQPLLWWSPSIRALIDRAHLKVSRSLRKSIRQSGISVTVDKAFDDVIARCAAPRPYARDTWITQHMQDAYLRLFQLGFAHSVETRWEGKLVGGLYGVAINGVYFGESMFSERTDASKIAFVALVEGLAEAGYTMIDCQMMTPHLESLGAYPVTRDAYLARLDTALSAPGPHFTPRHWTSTPGR